MPVEQELDSPKEELDFRRVQDKLYQVTCDFINNGKQPSFKGLLEVASSTPVILSAIHKIKANKGSETKGVDGESMRNNFLENDFNEVIERVKESFKKYKPVPVRRVYIEKKGSTELRPLGIPAIIDRIIQECIRSTIEPILEAQFFKHSYGFRPMRDAHMALNRVTDIVHKTGYHWIVEGDIRRFFDNVNHRILLKQLWHLGVKDRRILCIIKEMLETGIMEECQKNQLGTPQGGIISPLLANVYLHSMDQWITREWENKKLRNLKSEKRQTFLGVLHNTNLKPAYLVRYADDWVLITNSKTNAEKWKWRIQRFLKERLCLELSEEKTLITNVRAKAIKFVGFEFSVRPGKSRQGFIPMTRPNREKLKTKVSEIRKELHALQKLRRFRRGKGLEQLVHGINIVNSKIRGLIEYYDVATNVHRSLNQYAWQLEAKGFRALIAYSGKMVPADETNNLTSIHSRYKRKIPSVMYQNVRYGITSLGFCKWDKDKTALKRPAETPYTAEGREIYHKRTNKQTLKVRADSMLNNIRSYGIFSEQWNERSPNRKKLYNFEFFLNRVYAYNRDKGKCRICGDFVAPEKVHTHHIRPYLPVELVNRVPELASMHWECHSFIHDGKDHEDKGTKTWKKILFFRDKLHSSK
ncbi:group II intron reverse transcriptase/maturase [Brevibacillus centrosporus]|uniref:group II intron reverse transcriptase/maturase n=1 Tax=Brevibacillus centrosporus TaxID=54910 RepID=UPI003B024324